MLVFCLILLNPIFFNTDVGGNGNFGRSNFSNKIVSGPGRYFTPIGCRLFSTAAAGLLSRRVSVLGSSESSITNLALNDIFAYRRKDWFGHPFHLLNYSPLPIFFSSVLFCSVLHLLSVLRLTTISAFNHGIWLAFLVSIVLVWFYEVFTEELSAAHTLEVQNGFRIGIILFILSELMLFLSFF